MLIACAVNAAGGPKISQTDLFVAGKGGYHTYRIPAIVATGKNTLLAFCEGRRNSAADSGDIDILLRRSFDGGETWGEVQLVAEDGTDTCGNPCPIFDSSNGTLWLLFCKNLAHGNEGLITAGQAPRTVWATKSADDGLTWSVPTEITKQVKLDSWTWYATGPCHGIQLKSGRLLAPCDHVETLGEHRNGRSHVVYSDDHGQSWKIGGIIDGGNESTAVEVSANRVCMNCRNVRGEEDAPIGRLVAFSDDGGLTFGKPSRDNTLIEPICQASIIRDGDGQVIFSNPASGKREKLTIRLSRDGCVTWPVSGVLNAGHSAYSDLAIAQDGGICCLYERGDHNPYGKITFAKFSMEWLTSGADGP